MNGSEVNLFNLTGLSARPFPDSSPARQFMIDLGWLRCSKSSCPVTKRLRYAGRRYMKHKPIGICPAGLLLLLLLRQAHTRSLGTRSTVPPRPSLDSPLFARGASHRLLLPAPDVAHQARGNTFLDEEDRFGAKSPLKPAMV